MKSKKHKRSEYWNWRAPSPWKVVYANDSFDSVLYYPRKDIWLWLRGLPKLMPTHEQEDNLFYPVENGRKLLDFWSGKRNPNGRSLKSITFEGVARAMAVQWG